MVNLTIKTYLTFIFRHVFQGDNRTQSFRKARVLKPVEKQILNVLAGNYGN